MRGIVDASVAPVHAAVASAIATYVATGGRVAVGLSGGIDSMVLLDALTLLATEHALEVVAIHVHHGLSPNADAWAQFCETQCALRSVPITVRHVSLQRAPGESLEALAREARHRALSDANVDAVVLAHHADDQAESVLLQLLRGAGPHGLAGMPAHRHGKPALLRPLLHITRAQVAAYASARGLRWIDDESNADYRYRRNFLRGEVSPALAAKFPGYPATLVRAAAHQAEAATLLDELAKLDGAIAIDDIGLDRACLVALSPARARNLLRWFLQQSGLRAPSAARLADMLRQLQRATGNTRTRIAHDGMEVGCHRDRVVVHAPTGDAFECVWHGEAEVGLPGGILAFERVHGDGLAAAPVERLGATLCSRVGGERIRLAANRPRQAVKKLLQARGIPEWERRALPLVWCGDELAAVPGIGVAASFRAAPDEPGWRVEWLPRKPTRRAPAE